MKPTVRKTSVMTIIAQRKADMRIAIVEDDTLFRENLKMLLSGDTNIDVIGVFASAEEALPALKKLRPEISLVDLGLPGMSGIDLIRELREKAPDIEILAHTVYDERETVFAAIKAGAAGYLLKGCSPRELIEALHNLYAGGAPMSQPIARKVIQEFQANGVEKQYLLTQRECEVVRSIQDGLAYKEIADRLGISRNTVHSHIKHIYEKLQARDRQEALIKARRKGII